jgi:hypothetical protein
MACSLRLLAVWRYTKTLARRVVMAGTMNVDRTSMPGDEKGLSEAKTPSTIVIDEPIIAASSEAISTSFRRIQPLSFGPYFLFKTLALSEGMTFRGVTWGIPGAKPAPVPLSCLDR